MTETSGAQDQEPDAGQGDDDRDQDERGHREADPQSGHDERGEQPDQDAGSSPAW